MMEIKRLPVVVVDHADPKEFEAVCKKLYEADYRLESSSCGFLQSEAYQFCSSYQAIFVDKRND